MASTASSTNNSISATIRMTDDIVVPRRPLQSLKENTTPKKTSNTTPKANLRKNRSFHNDLKKSSSKSAVDVASESTSSTTPNKCQPEEQLSIFRTHRPLGDDDAVANELDDVWTIRRANPIVDESDDEEDEVVELENLHPERSFTLYWDDAQTAPISFR